MPQTTSGQTDSSLFQVQSPEYYANIAKVNPTIFADNLSQTQSLVNLPNSPTDNTNYLSMVNQGNAEIKSLMPDTSGLDPVLAKYLNESTPPPSTAEAYTQAQSEAGIDQKQQAVDVQTQRVNALKAQLAGLTGETQARELQIGKEAISAGAIQGRNIEEERNLAIRAIPLQAQILAEQATLTGNQALLESAQNKLNTLFQLKVQDAQNQYNYQKELRNAVYDYATKKEKQALDQQALEDERAYNEKKDRLTTINNLAQTYPDAGISPDDTFEQAQAKVTKSASFKMKQKTEGGLTPAQINTTVNSIRSAFDNEPVVKNFNVISEGKAFVDSLPNTTTNPADDQALIYALAKALDPNSVVREGEYATAQKYSQSWAKAYGKSITQAVAGTGFLSQEARKNIKQTINARYQASLKNYQNVRNEYQRQIDDAKAGNEPTITDYSKAYNFDSNPTLVLDNLLKEQQTISPKQETTTPQSGGLLSKLWGLFSK